MRLALVAILAVAAGLRFAGIGFGLPLALRPDEQVFREAVARMAETGDLDPRRFEYGGPLFHALYGVTWAAHATARLVDAAAAGTFPEFARRPEVVIPIQRALSACLGVATVLLAWSAGRRLAGEAAGLAAAALLAVTFLAVRDSHFGTVDVPAAFASMAALLAILRAANSGTRGAFVLAGLLSGLAAAVRYVPVVLALPLWFAAWRAGRARGLGPLRAAVGPRALLSLAAMIAGAILAGPYSIVSFDELRAGFASAWFVGGQSNFEPLVRLREIAVTGLVRAADWPLAAASAVALAVALIGPNPAARILAIFVVAYVAALSAGTNFFLRWLNPVIPPLCVLCGALVARATRDWKHGGAWCAAIVAALGVLPAVRSVGIDRLFLRDTTLQQTAGFFEEQVPADAVASCPNPGVARMLGGRIRLVPWDPHALAAHPEWWAVVPRHPFPQIGRDPAWVGVVFRGAADVECVARFPAIDAERWDDAEFEAGDHFFYPLRGFGALERAGPDVDDPEGAPAPERRRPRPGRRRRSSRSPSARRRSASRWARPMASTCSVTTSGFAPEPEAAAGRFLGPFACGREPLDLPLTQAIRGRYVLQAATVGPTGLGRWSDPVVVAIE